MHVCVVVLGDVGRSPRMQYHCTSLAENGMSVTLVGYKGESCRPEVQSHRKIQMCLMDTSVVNWIPV
jgi:beta-1,4-mannosyltransferase